MWNVLAERTELELNAWDKIASEKFPVSIENGRGRHGSKINHTERGRCISERTQHTEYSIDANALGNDADGELTLANQRTG
jgi:hypothetical protein